MDINNTAPHNKSTIPHTRAYYLHNVHKTVCCIQHFICHKFPRLRKWDQRLLQGTWRQSPLIGVFNSGYRGWGGAHLQHWLSAQCWTDGINIWPNVVGTFNRLSGIQKVCSGFRWIHRNVDKKYSKLKMVKKINHDLWDALLHLQN